MRKLPLISLVLSPVSKLLVPIVLLLLAAAPSAHAQTTARSGPPVFGTGNGSGGAGLGVGAAVFMGGMGGVEVVYDQPRWHIEGLIGFDSRETNNVVVNPPTRTEFNVGVRAWYHLHEGSNADFSVGGGVGFDHVSFSNNGGSGTETFLEPGAEARVFLTPSFALFGLAGLSLAFGDAVRINSGVALTSQLTAGFGFTYFFR